MAAEPIKPEKKKEAYKKVLYAWFVAVKSAQLYSATHTSFLQTIKNLQEVLAGLLANQVEFAVQHTDGLFLIENMLFVEESLTFYDLLKSLEDMKVSTATFISGVTEDELAQFIGRIQQFRVSQGQDAGGPLASAHIRTETDNELQLRSGQKGTRLNRCRQTYEAWLELAATVIAKTIEEQTVSMADLSGALEALLDDVRRDPESFALLIANNDRPAPLLIGHTVDTLVMSAFIGEQLGLDESSLKLLALCALLHDVGRHLLPADFTTGYELAPEETGIVHLHCDDGASLLCGIPGLPLLVSRVALEHHSGFDHEGYPALSGVHETHVFSQVVELASFVSWRTVSERFYHRPVALPRLLRAVVRRAGTQFNPMLVKIFLPFFGLYPPGSRVSVSGGAPALAAQSNLRNITRPAIIGGTASNPVFFRLAQLTATEPPRFPVTIERLVGFRSLSESEIALIPETTDYPS